MTCDARNVFHAALRHHHLLDAGRVLPNDRLIMLLVTILRSIAYYLCCIQLVSVGRSER